MQSLTTNHAWKGRTSCQSGRWILTILLGSYPKFGADNNPLSGDSGSNEIISKYTPVTQKRSIAKNGLAILLFSVPGARLPNSSLFSAYSSQGEYSLDF